MDNKDKLEKSVLEALTDGPMEVIVPDKAAVQRLAPRYEIRQIAQQDPILEETRIFRSIAKEVDGRYDTYVASASKEQKNEDRKE